MAQRDRAERGGRKGARAAQRSHAPAFLDSDNDMDDEDGDELGIANMKRRTRKQYDERRDADDLDGVDNVSSRVSLLLSGCLFVFIFRKSPWSNLATSRRNRLWNGLPMTAFDVPSCGISVTF